MYYVMVVCLFGFLSVGMPPAQAVTFKIATLPRCAFLSSSGSRPVRAWLS